MTSLRQLQKNWEGFARTDPLWAICTDSARHGSKWIPEEFFATGRQEIHAVLSHLESLGLTLDKHAPALDFGCGVGRLTAALSVHFDECCGVDISPTMIQMAATFHESNPRCRFLVNETSDLRQFNDGHFGFIYSSIVLQHIHENHVHSYLSEFIRVLKVGGILVFQIPDRDRTHWLQKIRNRVGLRRKITRLLGRKSIHAFRMAMHCIPESKIRQFLSGQNVRIVDVRLTNSTDGNFNGNLQFLDEEPQHGFVSKQYCVVKHGKEADG